MTEVRVGTNKNYNEVIKIINDFNDLFKYNVRRQHVKSVITS